MSKKSLVIVESPAKAGTLKKYLGAGFEVKATVGHIKDLPAKRLGVDLENDFAPEYTTIPGKAKVIQEIMKSAQGADVIYLAPDPDREGEAIAWHIAEELGPGFRTRIKRVMFNEITKNAILKAIQQPLELNLQRFESQQARRILDRLVGYKISPILWQKVKRGISAGRVQSVAVRLVVERDSEIQAFKKDEFWNIEALLEKTGRAFKARLTKEAGEKLDKLSISNQKHAEKLVGELQKSVPWKVSSVQKKERKRYPDPPFITSRLQQEASRKLRFTAKKTMTLAQKLYEGMEVGAHGTVGLITYMRTDSMRVGDEAIRDVRQFIEGTYGSKYLPEKPNFYKAKKEGNVQDAHEAIRPTSMELPPESVKPYLENDSYRLYQLIWNRFVSSQMMPAVYDQTTVDIGAGAHELRATGSILRFAGFTEVYSEEPEEEAPASAVSDEDVQLPDLNEGDVLTPKEITPSQHFTQPPPRFTEASLVRELEERGIGRPSTYAAILSTIVDRGYVEKKENRFFPTELGVVVTDLLLKSFPKEMDFDFTAQLELSLDKIEEGEENWIKVLKNFYDGFEERLDNAKKDMRNLKREETPTDFVCPKCTKKMVIRWGKNGQFIACTGYPDCKSTMPFTRDANGGIVLVKEAVTDEKCPNCGLGMTVKSGKFGRFLACTGYPDCKTTKPLKIGVKCPQPDCGGDLTERRSGKGKTFYGCTNYPKCTFATWDQPLALPCPQCQAPFVTKKITKREGILYVCVNKSCLYKATEDEWRLQHPEAAGAPGAAST